MSIHHGIIIPKIAGLLRNNYLTSFINHVYNERTMAKTIKQELFLLLLFGCFLFFTVNLFWKNNTVTGTLIISASIGIFMCWWNLNNLIAYFLAGLLGFTCEYILTKQAYWHYNNPSIIPFTNTFSITSLPWWLFFLWGYFIVWFIQTAYLIERLMKNSKTIGQSPSARKQIFLSLWSVVIVYVLSIYANLSFDLTRWFLVIIIPVALFWRQDIDLIAFFTGALCGTLGEWTSIRSGVFQYHFPYFSVIGIPLCLPLSWGLSTVFIRRVSLLFKKERN